MSLILVKQGNLLEYNFDAEESSLPISFDRNFIIDILSSGSPLASTLTLQKNLVIPGYLIQQPNQSGGVDVFYDDSFDAYWEDLQDFNVAESTTIQVVARALYRLTIKPGNYISSDGTIFTRLRVDSSAVLGASEGGTGQSVYNFGDLLYASAADTLSKLPGNKTSAPLILTSRGDGEGTTSIGWEQAPILGTTIYFWSDIASDVVGYLKQTVGSIPTQANITTAGITNGQLITSFISDVGLPNASFFPEGQYSSHLYAVKNSGTNNIQIRAEAWEVSSTGADIVKITDLGVTSDITNVTTDFFLAATSLEHTFVNSSSRLATKLYALVQGSGTNPSVSIVIGGATDSRTNFPSVAVDTSNFVSVTGAAALSVKGNTTNVTGNVTDIVASSDGSVLRRLGSSIGFGLLSLVNGVSGVLGISNGGTGATTQPAAINALLPTQTSNAGKYLVTDGTNPGWATIASSSLPGYFSQSFSAVTSVNVNHNFGQFPVVTTLDASNNVFIPFSISHSSQNSCVVSFSAATTGIIICSVGAPQSSSVKGISSTYSMLADDYTLNCVANSFAITLLPAASVTGKMFVIKNSGAGSITLSPQLGQTIDGLASFIIGPFAVAPYPSVTIQSDGSNYLII